MSQILIIDDEQDILDLLAYNLKREGFSVITAKDGITGRDAARNNLPDIIILDLMLPHIDGMELCRMLRKEQKTAQVPIIMLTARGQEMDKIFGLDMGADDYVTKPFSVREIIARVKALLRRASNKNVIQGELYSFGSLQVDLPTHQVRIDGNEIFLSPLEFKLLRFFITHAERVYDREQILNLVWGHDAFVESRTVDVHIRRLREKLHPEGSRLIQTVRGTGYRFKAK